MRKTEKQIKKEKINSLIGQWFYIAVGMLMLVGGISYLLDVKTATQYLFYHLFSAVMGFMVAAFSFASYCNWKPPKDN
jgi:hypothetical protein